jgi:hypothetical protein
MVRYGDFFSGSFPNWSLVRLSCLPNLRILNLCGAAIFADAGNC